MNFLRKSRPALFSLIRTLKIPLLSPSSCSLCTKPQIYDHGERSRWYHDPHVLFVLVASCISGIFYHGKFEIVPYTNRTRYVLTSFSLEAKREADEINFNEEKTTLSAKILPSSHPDTVRVRLIVEQIIGATQSGLDRDEGKRKVNSGMELEANKHLEGFNWFLNNEVASDPTTFFLRRQR